MKYLILGLMTAGALTLSTAQPAQAQISVGIPGTGINVNYNPFNRGYYNDGYNYNTYPNYYYNNGYNNGYYYNRYNNSNRYYNRYNNGGFHMNGRGRMFANGYPFTGWRGGVYYRNGWAR